MLQVLLCQLTVAPFTGAWIEMTARTSTGAATGVAPFTGAWIEIICSMSMLIWL